MKKNNNILSSAAAKTLQETLQSIEGDTNGKAIVHMDQYCKGDAKFKAAKIFKELNLLQHPAQNGALIYIATVDRKLAIILDQALAEVVEDDFISKSCSKLALSLQNNEISEGLKSVLHELKQVWKNHFPNKILK
jgi:uncharacterized membrane protein